jgi:Protein of unknown function (DUF3168)
MKDIRLAFRALLLSDPTVNTLCGGRCYPVQMPQNMRSPSLVYFRVSDFSDYHMLGDSGLQRISMQLSSWADKHDLSVNLADAAHDALTGFAGRVTYDVNFIDIRGIFQTNGRDLLDHETQLYNMSRDYTISYAED